MISKASPAKKMVSQKIQDLKFTYKNGPDDIGKDFVSPCLRECTLFRRGSGFFSSSALIAYADAIDAIVDGKTKIQILCSPVIQDKILLEALKNTETEQGKLEVIRDISNKLVLLAVGYKLDPNNVGYRSKLLAYFLASGALEIRFAIPRDFQTLEIAEDSKNLYHVKTGYFEFDEGYRVAFSGSFNESGSGHHFHVDETQVFKSWDQRDTERVQHLVREIDRDWNGENPYVLMLKPDSETMAKIRGVAPSVRPKPSAPRVDKSEESHTLRDYQEECLQAWKRNFYRGIFAMATGTGKTRTAIAAVKRFRAQSAGGLVVVTVPKQALCEQWDRELREHRISAIKVYDDQTTWRRNVEQIFLAIQQGVVPANPHPVLVCVNDSFKDKVFQELLCLLASCDARKMIVVDECHWFNKTKNLKFLPDDFQYRIGLSATPYEDGESRILEKYFGDVVFEFTIARAIKERFLCPYEYFPLFIEMTEKEAGQYVALLDKLRASNSTLAENDAPAERDVDQANNEQLDGVLNSLVAKMAKLEELIDLIPNKAHTLFYCGMGSVKTADGDAIRQIDAVSSFLTKHGWNVSRITYRESKTERISILSDFREGKIDAITSIRVLDEGVDIPDCETAFIFASQRSQRQGIQRRGRVLRMAPGKQKAALYDFIIVGPHLRVKELENLYQNELSRARMFASDALNSDECLKAIESI
jgi:superfamily II DNA or RNA helicase